MTRKEEIQKQAEKKAFEPSRLMHPYAKQHKVMSAYEIGYIEGAEWADAHPDIDVRTMAAWQSGYDEGIAKYRWISVEDELPKDFKIVEDSYYAGKFEESDIVMVAFDDGDFGFARYVHDFPNAEEGEAWYWFAEGNLSGVSLDDGEVTHWMPLPAPPKGGKK